MIRSHRVHLVHGSLVGAGLLAATACTVGTTMPGGGAQDGGPTGQTGSPLGFTASNVDLGGIDLTKVGDFVVDNDECTISTDELLASCGDGGDVLQFKVATQSDGSKVAVYVAKSMTVQAAANLTVQGSLPLVFIALGTVDVAGTINANALYDVVNGGGVNVTGSSLKGAGPGGGSAGTTTAAGGGGSYCGPGGAGAAESGATLPGGAVYGNASITPLRAGSSGGSGGDVAAGGGGGAVQLTAGASITIEQGGLIQVGGGGGGFGGISGQEGSAGGSGGAILLESLDVTVAGTLAANGAGGGAGTSSNVPSGSNSTPDATPAPGGDPGGVSAGGDGSAGSSVNGTDGAFTAGNSAGAGGGGAGRIRINTRTGQATLSGVVSPSASTACATQGTVQVAP